MVCGADTSAPEITRQRLFQVLLSNKVLNPDRQIVSLYPVCNLIIKRRYYPVANLVENVKGAMEPRGVGTIVVLDPKLKPVQKIDYAAEMPLFCKDNQLFVAGDLSIEGIHSQGNAITFTNDGKTMELRHVEANDYPLPKTRNLRSAPQ